jgi:Protein of unknown function (DUF3016)
MNRQIHGVVLGGVLALSALSATAATTVNFIKPTGYTDIGYYGLDSSYAMKVLEEHFIKLGENYLAPNQDLKIEVLDVDLAGQIDYNRWRIYNDRRVLSGTVDWPRIKFHYVLQTDGKIIADAEADIADMDYLNHIGRYYPNVSYPYERRMLENWFKATFREAK